MWLRIIGDHIPRQREGFSDRTALGSHGGFNPRSA